MTVTTNPAHASPAELAATRTLAGITATAGPFAAATVVQFGGRPFGQLILAGRPSPGGPVDDVIMNAGHWPDAPGQVVLDGVAAPGGTVGHGGPQVGSTLTVTGLRGTSAAGGRRGRGPGRTESHHGHAHRRRFRQLHHEHRGRLGHRG